MSPSVATTWRRPSRFARRAAGKGFDAANVPLPLGGEAVG
jgi:hypothetical protein